MDGQTLPQDFKRAAELLRSAADAGTPEAQYALATFYKEGNGLENLYKSVRLLQAASPQATSMPKSSMRSRCSTAAAPRRTRSPRYRCCTKPPDKTARSLKIVSPGCSSRTCGVPKDKIEGLKWHIVGEDRRQGRSELDEAMAQATPEERAKAESAARKWLGIQ